MKKFFKRVSIVGLVVSLGLVSNTGFADFDPNKVIDETGSGSSLASSSFESNDSFASNDSMGSKNSFDNANSFGRKNFDVKCQSSLGKYYPYLDRYKRTDLSNLTNPNKPIGSHLLARRMFLPYWNKLGEGVYDKKQDKVTFVRPGFKTIVCNASSRPQVYFWFDGYFNAVNRIDTVTPKSLNFRLMLKPWERVAYTSRGAIAILQDDHTYDGAYYNVRDYWNLVKARDANGRGIIARYEITGKDTFRIHLLTRERIQYPIRISTGFTGINKFNRPEFTDKLIYRTIELFEFEEYKKKLDKRKKKQKNVKHS